MTGLSLKTFMPKHHPVRLDSLEPGAKFKLHWEGGAHPKDTPGTLLLANISRARVRVPKSYYQQGRPDKEVAFVDGDRVREFVPHGSVDTDWSPGTLVIPTGDVDENIREEYRARSARKEGAKVSENSDGGPEAVRRTVSLKPSRVQSDEEQTAPVKEEKRTMAKTTTKTPEKGNGSTKAAKAPKAPVALTPDGKCLCGCGEQVTKRFKPGHDARMFGWFKKVASGDMDFNDLPKAVKARVKDKAGVKKELAAH